jgi:N-acetylmuramoyl-L-alanine amidase
LTTIKYRPLIPQRVAFLVVHCSATRPSQDFDVNDIRRMHLQRGFFDVGYHFVIKRDGTVQTGRPLDRQGAHVQGYNHLSVGVCMIGGVTEDDVKVPENNFTPEQFASLRNVLAMLKQKFPHAEILGHRDMPHVHKACPSFDVRAWLNSQ